MGIFLYFEGELLIWVLRQVHLGGVSQGTAPLRAATAFGVWEM